MNSRVPEFPFRALHLWQHDGFASIWLWNGRWLVSVRVVLCQKCGGWRVCSRLQSSISPDHAITGGTVDTCRLTRGGAAWMAVVHAFRWMAVAHRADEAGQAAA